LSYDIIDYYFVIRSFFSVAATPLDFFVALIHLTHGYDTRVATELFTIRTADLHAVFACNENNDQKEFEFECCYLLLFVGYYNLPLPCSA
jgi:hypothetical protein